VSGRKEAVRADGSTFGTYRQEEATLGRQHGERGASGENTATSETAKAAYEIPKREASRKVIYIK